MSDRLHIVVEADGEERDYEMLSGGERFRIDFALRIALALYDPSPWHQHPDSHHRRGFRKSR